MAVFSAMGVMITLFWLINVVMAIFLGLQKFDRPEWGLAIKLGLFLAVIGAGLGYLMTSPTAEQLATMEATGRPTQLIGAHSVGVPDGGQGLPFVGWSTEGGDLRIGHFIGLHGMQVLPLIGWFIVKQNSRLSARRKNGLIWTAGLSYLGVIFVVTWQALRAEPLIYPSTLTLISWAIWLVATITASLWFLRPETSKQAVYEQA